ncbi:hypothetical protein [Sanguibacter sp. HDW7]|uniref:hypothetical protein n=1 Tax=Sanguibacter sp. HDW7 TaxID=2714931 RepID=UPI00140BB425|nr:hypothetical protein [Sanguibacter sp. HDW7]QIK82414.1 hypothetical protein G7063_01385 [Sanguibacter sp. HDW7]
MADTEPTECECGRLFPTWAEWQRHSQRPNGYNPPGPGTHRRVLRIPRETRRD